MFPILVGILFGIIDGGRYIATRAMLSQAAAVGVRTACLYSTTGPTTVDSAIAGAAPMLTGVNTASISCLGACGWPKTAGDSVVLTAQYRFVPGFYRNFAQNMTQTSRMVCE